MNKEEIHPESDEEAELYQKIDDIDFSILASQFRNLPFYEDDLFLGMQAMNVGFVDAHVTQMEHYLLREYIEIERTPIETCMTVGALSQMWVYGTYEVLRMWRERKYQFEKWLNNGGIKQKIASLNELEGNIPNLTQNVRKRQLEKFKEDPSYRESINFVWDVIEPAYKLVELYRINLAKHSAPGKGNMIPRAPGYGRINMFCGSMNYELTMRTGEYTVICRRDIADCLRNCLTEIMQKTSSHRIDGESAAASPA